MRLFMQRRSYGQIRITVAGALMYCAGTTIFYFVPAYLGGIERKFGVSPTDLGLLSAAELWAIACASAIGPLWISRFDWRALACFGALSALAGHTASLFVSSFDFLLAIRVATGFFGEGVLLALSYATLGHSRNFERSFSITYGVAILLGIAGLSASPELDRYLGTISVLAILAVASLATFAAGFIVPSGPKTATVVDTPDLPATESARRPSMGALALAAQGIWYAGAGGFWSFSEQIAATNGFTGSQIARALGVGTAGAILGSLLVLVVSKKIGSTVIIVASTAIMGAAILAFVLSQQLMLSSFFLVMFNMCCAIGTIYITGAICASDDTGRIAALVPAFQVGGMAIGTATLGYLINDFGIGAGPWMTSACFIVSIAIYLVARGRMSWGGAPRLRG